MVIPNTFPEQTIGDMKTCMSKSLPLRVICTKSVQNWHVEGLTFAWDEDDYNPLYSDVGSDTSSMTSSIPFWVDTDSVQNIHSAQEDSMNHLEKLLMSSCGFLRICESEVHPESSERAKRRGSTAILRMYIRSLPLTKRAKWLSPLLWSVSVALQRKGCAAKIQANELYVPLNGTAWARIDFVAARE